MFIIDGAPASSPNTVNLTYVDQIMFKDRYKILFMIFGLLSKEDKKEYEKIKTLKHNGLI